MPIKVALTPPMSCFILLAALALLLCIDSGSKVATASSVIDARNDALDREVGGQIHRYLRESKWTAEQEDGSPEARAIGVKLSTATVLQKLINSQPTTKFSARVIEKITSNNQRATDKLFASLGVWEVESKLFASAPYQKWSASVMKSYKKDFEKGQAAIFSTLVRHHDDDILAKLVAEAQPNAAAIKTAKKFETMQIDNWITNRKTEEGIYKLLKLDTDKDILLRNPLLNTWISYVKKLGNEDPYNLLLLKLTKNNDEEALARTIIAAEDDSLTRSMALHLESSLFTTWLRDGKTTDDIAKLLGLNADKGESFLRNAALPTWLSYVRRSNKDPNEVLFLELRSRFSDAKLARVLVAASRDGNVKINVTALQKLQLSNWLGRKNTAGDIFRHLGLSKEGEKLLESSMFNTWVSYLKLLDDKHTDALMISVMRKHYSDQFLEKLIVQAKTKSSTKTMALNWEAEMWRSQGKTADDIFRRLGLSKAGGNLFERSQFDTWVSYVKLLDDSNTDDLMFSVMKKHYSDEILENIIAQAKTEPSTRIVALSMEAEMWRSQGRTADDIFKFLRLDKAGDDLFEARTADTWVSYVERLNKYEKHPKEYAAILELQKRFDYVDLARMLSHAKIQAGVTGHAAARLNQQFDQWMNLTGLDPGRVATLVARQPHDTRNAGVILGFYDFYKANGGSPFY